MEIALYYAQSFNSYLKDTDGLTSATYTFFSNAVKNVVLTKAFVRIASISGAVMTDGTIRIYKQIGPTQTDIIPTTTLTALNSTANYFLFNLADGLHPIVLVGEDLKADIVAYTGPTSMTIDVGVEASNLFFWL